MMKKLLMLLVLAALVSACGLTKKDLGLEKTTPDTSNVSANDALILPPNYSQRPVVEIKKAEE